MFKLQAQSSTELSKALSTVAKCMDKKNSLAILDNILLRKDGDKFLFTTSRSDAELTIGAPLTLVSGNMDKAVCLPSQGVISYISALPECTVTLTFSDSLELSMDYCLIKGENTKAGKATLVCLPGDDFPFINANAEFTSRLTLPGGYFSQVIKQAKNFVANDELRPQMNGMLIDVNSDSTCNFVASDGHKLYRCTRNDKGDMVQPFSVVLDKERFSALSAFEESESVIIEANANVAHVFNDDIDFRCTLIDARYPNYSSVIPTNNPFYIVFDKKEMIESLKRVRLFGSPSSQLVRFDKEGSFVKVSAQDIDYSTNSSEQVCVERAECTEGFAIGFSADILVNALNAITEDRVRLSFCSPDRAAILTADVDSPLVLILCMPMQLL